MARRPVLTLAEPISIEVGSTAYKALHHFMNDAYPRTGRCERCGAEGRATHLAIARHDGCYTTNRADWLELCVPCHARFDGRNNFRVMHGEANGRAKLCEADVREIRARYAVGDVSQPQLGREYGVSHIMIGKIVRRQAWANVT